MAKNLPAMQEICVQSLGGEDPLEKGMATHFSILIGEFHEQRNRLAGYSPLGRKELDTKECLTHTQMLRSQSDLQARVC